MPLLLYDSVEEAGSEVEEIGDGSRKVLEPGFRLGMPVAQQRFMSECAVKETTTFCFCFFLIQDFYFERHSLKFWTLLSDAIEKCVVLIQY